MFAPNLQAPADLPHISDQNPLEASLAPREGDLLNLPFDQYGRMRIVQNIMRVLYGEIAGQVVHPTPRNSASACSTWAAILACCAISSPAAPTTYPC